MNRRNFIKIAGLGVGSVALSSTLTSCSDSVPDEYYSWNGPATHVKDIRMQVLAYAILCPNPHNKQPWIIHLTGPASFNLHVDPDRLLPETDPVHRQIHIGQGTFLETLAIAANGLGYKANIEYFPEGMYGNTELIDKPVAAIELVRDAGMNKDPLFNFLLQRHSNKREYGNYQLNESELSTLRNAHQRHGEYSLTVMDSPQGKANMVKIFTNAMQIEVGNPQRDMETIEMFRFNDDEIRKFRDGFGVAQTGMNGVTKFIAETFFLDRKTVEEDPTEFGQQAVDMTQKVSESTNTFAWLSSTGNSRLDQIKIGRDYCRMNLQTTSMGLAQHPMSQVLQEYDDMRDLQVEFKQRFNIPESETVQMLFRIGKAEPVTHGPRRLVTQLIQSA
ncbi:MAG: twin-arginine translocation pathway signal protein [Gammaproteobacteria bacterium]|nr:twin-arginine translocation pathway signal protein [Gammaproteobacteria bacterium]